MEGLTGDRLQGRGYSKSDCLPRGPSSSTHRQSSLSAIIITFGKDMVAMSVALLGPLDWIESPLRAGGTSLKSSAERRSRTLLCTSPVSRWNDICRRESILSVSRCELMESYKCKGQGSTRAKHSHSSRISGRGVTHVKYGI